MEPNSHHAGVAELHKFSILLALHRRNKFFIASLPLKMYELSFIHASPTDVPLKNAFC